MKIKTTEKVKLKTLSVAKFQMNCNILRPIFDLSDKKNENDESVKN